MTWTHRIEHDRDFIDSSTGLALEWSHGGGYRRSLGIWRWRGLPFLIVEAGEA